MEVKDDIDHVRRIRGTSRVLDDMDRRILAELARDAGQSLAQLGKIIGLSAPAVHERVKRLRLTGVIKGTVAVLDGAAIGKPLLAFIHVDTVGWGKGGALTDIADLPEIEEMHAATGDTCIIVKARVSSPESLEGLLARIYGVEGVRGTRTYVVLSTQLERTVRAEVTRELAEEPGII